MLSEKWITNLIETEQHLLGGVILRNEYFELLELSHDDFYDPLHREIYREIEGLVSESRSFTPVDLKPRLLDEMSGVEVGPYLVRLLNSSVVGPHNILSYQEHIKEGSALTKIHNLAGSILSCEDNSHSVIDDIEATLEEIQKGQSGKQASMSKMIDSSVIKIEQTAKGEISNVKTGLTEVDEMLGGLVEQEVIIIAGRPAMGKTTKAMQWAMNIARQGIGCIFFTLEMSFDQMASRIYCEMLFREGGYNLFYNKIKKGVNDKELEDIARVSFELKNLPLVIDDRHSLSLTTLKTRSRAYMRQMSKRGIDVKVIFVDYLQLMTSSTKYSGQRVQEVSEITRGLKTLAKELDVTIVALSQLSRKCEERSNKRPMLSDLRESGSIEQDADAVIFTYRHEYYLGLDKPDDLAALTEWQSKMQDCQDIIEFIVSKQRSGETGTVKARCAMGASKVYD